MSQSMIIYYIPGSGALSEKCGESKLYPPPLKKWGGGGNFKNVPF